jgi:RNA-binding protein Musashi
MSDYYGNAGRAATGTSAPGSSLQHSDHAKIFVGGLSWQTTEESLRWHFEQYGQVISVEVMRDRNTGGAFGFIFPII